MGAQTALTLNTKTYAPGGMRNNAAVWVERSGGVSNSFSTLTQSSKDAGVGPVSRVTAKLVIPIVATADSTCSCTGAMLRSTTFNLEALLPAGGSVAERTDAYLRLKDYIASDAFKLAIENLDPVYG